MRIVSKFKDYYDCIAAYGTYAGLQYIRTSHQFDGEAPGWTNVTDMTCVVIGFCGKIYPCFITGGYGNKRFFYTKEELLDYYGKENPTYNEKYRFGQINGYFDRISRFDSKVEEFFRFHKTPIWLYERDGWSWNSKGKVTLNPCLRPYDFMRVKPPYIAFQEIAMWLANQASPEKEIPQLSDNDMRDIKGFNKYSFRKDKRTSK